MLPCKYHPQRQARFVFKAHAPSFQNPEDTETVHRLNIFLCDECASPSNEKEVRRYARVRTVKQMLERLPDNWEKYWPVLYLLDGYYYFVQPGTVIYYVQKQEA